MFQYAYAYALLKKFPILKKINCDIREYEKYKTRNFELFEFDYFKCEKPIINGKLKYDSAIRFFHIYQKIYKSITKKVLYKTSQRNLKKGFIFSTKYCDFPSSIYSHDVYLYGYFQDYSVFNEYRNDLIKIFYTNCVEKKKIYSKIKTNSIAISVRIGMDIQKLNWKVCDSDYYTKAINYIKDRHSVEQIIVYSDDIEFIKKSLWFEKMPIEVLYVDNLTSNEQLSLMTLSKDFIISNSTFSWWGAYLGYTNDSLIIAPKYWQGNNKLISQSKIFLPNFIILNEENE